MWPCPTDTSIRTGQGWLQRPNKHSGTLFFHLDDGVTLVEKADLTETRYVVYGVGEGQARIAQGRSSHWIPPTFLSWDHTSSAP